MTEPKITGVQYHLWKSFQAVINADKIASDKDLALNTVDFSSVYSDILFLFQTLENPFKKQHKSPRSQNCCS